MGANQSTARHNEEEPSRRFACCGGNQSDDDNDDFAEMPEKRFQIRHGRIQPAKAGRKSPFRSPLRTPEPLMSNQPAMRSKMNLGGSLTPVPEYRLASSPDLAISAGKSHQTTVTTKEQSPEYQSRNAMDGDHFDNLLSNPATVTVNEGPKLELPLLGLGAADLLPQTKRLSAMPDFTSLQSEEMKKIAVSDHWLMAKGAAQHTRSTRPSILDAEPDPPVDSTNAASARSLRASPTSPPSPPHTVHSGRKRAQTTNEPPRLTPNTTDIQPTDTGLDFLHNHPNSRGPSPALHIQTNFDIDHRPKPSVVSNPEMFLSQDTTKVNTPATRTGSPQRKRSKISRMRKDSAPGQPEEAKVEDAVRELERIVQSRRDPRDPETPSSTTTQSARSHRPAIAPKMLMKDVSSELLDDIGSGLSRPLSDGTMSSGYNHDRNGSTASSLPLSTVSRKRDSRRQSRRNPSWPGTSTTDGTTPRHSGTFFFSRKSLDEIISPDSGNTTTIISPFRKLDREEESPVDRHWSAGSVKKPQAAKIGTVKDRYRITNKPEPLSMDKPLPSNPPAGTPSFHSIQREPHSPTIGAPFIPFHRPNVSTGSLATTNTNFSLNSNLFPSSNSTPIPDMPPVPKSKKFPKPPRETSQQAPQSSALKNAPTRDSPSPDEADLALLGRTPSRGDNSTAVLAARKRAAARVAQEEANGMGLGIGGMLSAQDLTKVVEMDVWNAKPAHEHPSRSRQDSVATHKTDSILVEPSMSPAEGNNEGFSLDGSVERAMSVHVPRGHVAHLIRTTSGKNASKTGRGQCKTQDVKAIEIPKKTDAAHRPLAGVARNFSSESNTLPGSTPPSQNEARLRKQTAQAAQVQDQYLAYQQKYHQAHEMSATQPLELKAQQRSQGAAHAKQLSSEEAVAPEPKYRRPSDPRSRSGSKSAADPRNRSGSAAGHHYGAEFGLDLQRSASARRLREVEKQLEAMERQTAPPVPRNASVDSQVSPQQLQPPKGPYAHGSVRASQVGMAF